MAIRPLRECTLYQAGHQVHWIQVLRSLDHPKEPRQGVVVDVSDPAIAVAFGGELRNYRHHDVQVRREAIDGHGATVTVDEGWSIMRLASYCFSVVTLDREWTDCRFDAPTGISPEELADRLRSHGGF